MVGVSIAWILRAREWAQMSTARPEADTEYSRAPRASEARGGGRTGAFGATRIAVAAGALAAGLLLFAAEFLPLFEVHTSARSG